MSGEHVGPKALSDGALEQLADLLCIPPEQRGFFCDSIRMAVHKACDLDGLGSKLINSSTLTMRS